MTTGASAPAPVLSGAVDYWCNAFTPDRLPAWQRAIDNQELSLKVEREGDEFCTPIAMVERLDQAGFDTIVIPVSGAHPNAVVPEGTPAGQVADNFDQVSGRASELAILATEHPGRFAGMWSVDPTTGSAGIEEAAEMLAQPWCVALHNHTHSWDRPFDHPDFNPFYRLCAEHDVPFVMQAGGSGGRFSHDCGRPEPLCGPAAEFPPVRFVLSHTGWPWTAETIEVVRRFPNVYLGTATWPIRRWSDELRDFIVGEGAGQTMFATGFPTTGHAQAARQLANKALTLPSEILDDVMGDTARAVFTRLPAACVPSIQEK